MGIFCCEASPRLAHEDVEASRQPDSLSSSIAGTTAATATTSLPSEHQADNGLKLIPKPAPSAINQTNDTVSNKTKTSQDKKSVRISDEVIMIPLLTSASFFRKTPKPTMITNKSYGIMPSFRTVTPTTIAEESSDSDNKDKDSVAKSSLWWTKEERREILQANQKASRDFKRFQPTKIWQANLVYSNIVTDCCCRNECQHSIENYDDDDIYDFFRNQRSRTNAATASTSATASLRPPTKKRKRSDFTPTNITDDSDLPPPALPDATIDLPIKVRGLEWFVMPDAKRYRKAHAKTVLRWQDRFRRMNERRRTCYDRKQEAWDSTESSSSSSSSSEDETDIESSSKNSETTRHQQDLLLGQKASISSLRSCMLARVFGKSDEMAANPAIAKNCDLEEKLSLSWSPTPSMTGTSESSTSDSDSDENEDESDSESENENDSPFRSPAYRMSEYSRLQSANATSNSHKRMFRPRMSMMPQYWR